MGTSTSLIFSRATHVGHAILTSQPTSLGSARNPFEQSDDDFDKATDLNLQYTPKLPKSSAMSKDISPKSPQELACDLQGLDRVVE